MKVYLIQHGKATSKDENPDRPLNDDGRSEAERVAAAASRMGVSVEEVWHSGKTRALQTAEIFADRLAGSPRVRERDDVSPTDEPSQAATAIEEGGVPVLVVGHLPHLSRLVGLLVTGDAERELVRFRNAALVRLDETDGGWRIAWILSPEIAAARE